MTDAIVVFCTCPSEAEALQIARVLLERRLVACVNILPQMRSVYRWEGKVETASEHLLLIKTVSSRFEELRSAIVDLHSYDVPEVLALPVSDGTEKYLAWIRESV